ncbi:hypothetical protein NN561_014524 [Cricetulus griseus]
MVWLTCVLTLVAGTGLCTPKLTDLEEQVEGLAEPQPGGRRGGGGGPRLLRKHPWNPEPGREQLEQRPPPLSTQLARPPHRAGLKGPRTPSRPQRRSGLAVSRLSGDPQVTRSPSGSHRTPGTRFPGAGLAGRAGGGAEAGAQPGAAPGGGTGRSRSPERDRGGGSRAATAASCSACARPGNRSLQLTPPAARGLGLPSRPVPERACGRPRRRKEF